jgi:uncharacterized tellurite resistance protein B-like protein
MLDIVKRFFNKEMEKDANKEMPETGHDLRIATCALFVEIAKIDDEFTDAEMEKIISVLKDTYELSREHADALVASAEKELEQSLDLWQFAKLINNNYSRNEKIEIVETLWRIVYVDGKMDEHEHYLMNKLKNLLRLSHDDLIKAKLKVKDSL